MALVKYCQSPNPVVTVSVKHRLYCKLFSNCLLKCIKVHFRIKIYKTYNKHGLLLFITYVSVRSKKSRNNLFYILKVLHIFENQYSVLATKSAAFIM